MSDHGLDPVELQVITGALRAACEEMGAVLVRSAHSANIKERRDCSTALFDPTGEMVMQAEHIPVHLGAMPAAVAAVLGEAHEPGVSWVLNDPYAGGTHLPDITVVTPAFTDDGGLLGFAAVARPPRRRRRPRPGLDAGRLAHARRGGRRDRAARPRRGRDRRARRADAPARPAPRRPARAARRQPRRRACACASSRTASATDKLREATAAVLDYAERRTRACLEELEDGEREAVDVLEAARRRPRAARSPRRSTATS